MRFRIFLLLILASSCSQKNEVISLPDGRKEKIVFDLSSDSLREAHYLSGVLAKRIIASDGLEGRREFVVSQWLPDGKLFSFQSFINDSIFYSQVFTDSSVVFNGCPIFYVADKSIALDSLKVNEPGFQRLKLATPPNAVVRLIQGEYIENEEDRDYAKYPLKLLNISNSLSGFIVHYNQKGTYSKIVYWSVEDTLRDKIHKGFFIRSYRVTE